MAARFAPRCPKIHEHDLASMLRELERFRTGSRCRGQAERGHYQSGARIHLANKCAHASQERSRWCTAKMRACNSLSPRGAGEDRYHSFSTLGGGSHVDGWTTATKGINRARLRQNSQLKKQQLTSAGLPDRHHCPQLASPPAAHSCSGHAFTPLYFLHTSRAAPLGERCYCLAAFR